MSSQPDEPSQKHFSHRTLLLGLMLLVVGWLVAFSLTLWHLRNAALTGGLDLAATHARNFEEHLTQTLQVIDLTAGSIDPLSEGRINTTLLGSRLITALRPAPFLRSISLLDAQGRIIASSNPENLGIPVDIAGYYPPAKPDADILRISPPWRGRDFASGVTITPGTPASPNDPSFIAVLRHLTSGGQHFWLIAAINPDYLINHATRLVGDPTTQVQWLRYDGLLLTSTDPDDLPGSQTAAGEVQQRVHQREFGKLTQTLAKDREVLTAYQASSRFPALVAVHVDHEQALAVWRAETRQMALIVLPALLGLCIAGFLLWRRQQRIARQSEELDHQRRLAASVFDASSNSILLTTPEGDIIAANRAFEHISGYTAIEVLGQNPRILASGMQDKGFYRRMWEALLTEGHWEGELVNRRKDGRLYTGAVAIHAVKNEAGQLLHYVGVTADITETKRYQAELLDAKSRAEAAAMAKTSFLATMSHEIRTPMNGVLGMTELLLMADLPAEQREQLQIVKSSADSLLTLLNEILDYSKIEAQGVSIEAVHFNPAELVNDIIGLFGPRAATRGLTLAQRISPAIPRTVIGDPTRVRQILNNLVSNALKFTHTGGIVIGLQALAASANTENQTRLLEITVTDTGIGIPPEKQSVIFDVFEQADASTTRHYGGTGLGLAISRRLAEAMHGELSVSSTPGKGSCFTLTVRVHDDPDGVAQAAQIVHSAHRPPAEGVSGRALNLLIVDDTPTNRLVLRGMLAKLGHQVVEACDGAEALTRLQAQRFDAVLMDVLMPVMDGHEATRAIREREAATGEHLPVIALTASAYAADRDACFASGMDDFISKPIKLDDLSGALASIQPTRSAAAPP